MNIKLRKILSVLLAICIITAGCISAYADEESTTAAGDAAQATTQNSGEDTSVSTEEVQKTLEEQRADLEAKLKENEERLEQYTETAKATAEYIDALDEKIGYLNEELNLLDNEIKEAQSKVSKLGRQISLLKKSLFEIQEKYNQTLDELNSLNESFQSTYEAYCLRLRAMYISGTDSILVALITSKDISQFFSRFEMIKAIAKSDTALLKEVREKTDEIMTKKQGINEQRTQLQSEHSKMYSKQLEYKAEQEKVESKQNEAARKKITLAEKRAESDALLAEYSQKSQMYGEFRNEDEALIAQVNQEIDDLLSGLKAPDEVTTAVRSDYNPTSTTASESSTLYSNSNAVLNLTYPAPGHYAVSQGYGYYSNGKPHTGIDFPYPMGSKVVAAQKGIVITVKRLDYSYGYYIMIYHGTDAKGRKVVTLYAHNSSILVSVGQTVAKGEQIAKGGSTGNSTGPHCHFELIIGGEKVNPKNYLSK